MNNRVLIDTDILIDYFRNNIDAVEYLENENRELCISAINVAELYAGIINDEEMTIIKEFLTAFKIVNVNADIAECAGLIRKSSLAGIAKKHIVNNADDEYTEYLIENYRDALGLFTLIEKNKV